MNWKVENYLKKIQNNYGKVVNVELLGHLLQDVYDLGHADGYAERVLEEPDKIDEILETSHQLDLADDYASREY